MSDGDYGFDWNGARVATVGDVVRALMRLKDEAEAKRFMAEYRKANRHADANIGYCIGYIGGSDDASVARRTDLQAWCGTSHPVLGEAF